MIRKSSTDQTPMMQQYFKAKNEHPNDILFFRMGDFYEMFFEDAETVSELLGIALTSRSRDRSGTKIPMAGVPVKSVDTYIRRLLEIGKRVAICEQLQDPAEVKGIVDRGVVRVVTPGTFLDEENLDENLPLHLAALVPSDRGLGLAWLDLSTGKFFAEDVVDRERTEAALLRIAPRECLYPEGLRVEDLPALTWLRESLSSCALTPFPEWHFERTTGRDRLLAHFGTQSLEGFGCEFLEDGVRAAGALIHYLNDTQRQALPHITRLRPGATSRHLRLDAASHRALDLITVARTGDRRGSLLGLLDRTRTAMGARLLREWLCAPLIERDAILGRQHAVRQLVDTGDARDELHKRLGKVRDIERLSSRLPMGRVGGRDLKALEQSLRMVPEIRDGLDHFDSRELCDIASALDTDTAMALATKIGDAIVDEPPLSIRDGDVIRDGYEPELDELRSISLDGVNWMARFQDHEAKRTDIPNLKVGYNRVFGYFIEVTHSHRDKIPDDYVRKQTLKNAERYITPSLKEHENKVLGAKERADKLEAELFGRLRVEVQEQIPALQTLASALARLDVLASLARVAADEGHVAPEIVEEPVLAIEEGRHPVLAAGIGASDFTPNDVSLGGDQPALAVITGPNMAGKSTYIRQAALLTILAQLGAFVPARRATIGIADRIFTRVGAADDLTRGQSTFMVEMTETANILNNATPRSLIILDEVGRGTSTLDGVSLAWAITEHLVARSRARTLFATHYHELTELEERFPGAVKNLNVAVKEWQDQIVFLHKIIPGGTDKAYGIHVARLAGLPDETLSRAKEILSHLEASHGGSPAIPETRTPQPADTPLQLDLFGSAYDRLDQRLRAIAIDAMTPLDALNALAELKKLLP